MPILNIPEFGDAFVNLVESWSPPENTGEATSDNYFTLIDGPREFDYVYVVGGSDNEFVRKFTIKNNMVNASLQINANLPEYVLSEPSIPTVLAPLETREFILKANIPIIKDMVLRNIKTQTNTISLTFRALSSIGPVLVEN